MTNEHKPPQGERVLYPDENQQLTDFLDVEPVHCSIGGVFRRGKQVGICGKLKVGDDSRCGLLLGECEYQQGRWHGEFEIPEQANTWLLPGGERVLSAGEKLPDGQPDLLFVEGDAPTYHQPEHKQLYPDQATARAASEARTKCITEEY